MKKRNKLIIDITKSALFGETVRHPEPISSFQYLQIYKYAKQNGILAICLDGIQKLPKQLQPDKPLYMQWTAATASIEERYQTQVKTLEELNKTLSPHQIRILLFKGFSISRYYPIPKHREFGDLDVYMFDGFNKSHEILRKEGIHVHTANQHHAQFHMNDILIENHEHFLHRGSPRIEKALEEAAETTRQKQTEGILYLPDFENVAYTLLHICGHYKGNDCHIRFRALTDWALMLKEEGKSWHYSDMKKFIKHSYESKMMDLMTLVCCEWFDIVPENLLVKMITVPKKIKNRFIETVFDKKYQRKDEKNRWKRYWGHLYKHFRYAPLRKYLWKH
ncbi:MAG: nucleotidyltransferase family protein [Bacteroidales bacterium]|nr:nucleotidyltransferase family protein [Bacteroidales bacterium]